MINFFFKLKKLRRWMIERFPSPDKLGCMGKESVLEYPAFIGNPQNVYIKDFVKVRSGISVINSPSEKVIIKKYTVIASNVTFVTNNHKKTVNIPQFYLGASHMNDKSCDIVVEEDVWIGVGAIILAGAHLGRGCVIGAGTIVNKNIPPYSVVVGPSAKIIKKIFTVEQILEHEKTLYPVNDRLTREELENNEEKYFKDLKVFGTSDNNDSELAKIIINKTLSSHT